MTDKLKTELHAFERWMESLSEYQFARQFSNLMWQAWQARASLDANNIFSDKSIVCNNKNEINLIELFPNTVQLDEKDIHKACETFIRESDYTVVCPEEWMAEAIKSIAPPIKSVSDALNFLEEWALSGKTLHGDDIQRFRATVERIAQTVRVPDGWPHRCTPARFLERIAEEHFQGNQLTVQIIREGLQSIASVLSAASAHNGKKEG